MKNETKEQYERAIAEDKELSKLVKQTVKHIRNLTCYGCIHSKACGRIFLAFPGITREGCDIYNGVCATCDFWKQDGQMFGECTRNNFATDYEFYCADWKQFDERNHK